MPPAVSVIVPVRNGADEVPGLVERVAAWDGADIEVLVVDDASTDATRPLLDAAAARLPLIRVLDGAGDGVAAARNLAVGAARGDYVWFADCDDAWPVDVVDELLTAARGACADLVICNATKVVRDHGGESLIEDAPSSGLLSGVDLFHLVLRGEVQGHLWNKLFRREVLGRDPFPRTRAHSDLGGVLTVIPRLERVTLLPRSLYVYYVHGGSILNSRAYRWEDLTDCWQVAERSAAALGVAPRDADLRLFLCSYVALPLIHESIRRQSLLTEAERRAVWQRARALYSTHDLVLTATRGRPGLAAKLAAFRGFPHRYARAYRRYRSQHWAHLDGFTEGGR